MDVKTQEALLRRLVSSGTIDDASFRAGANFMISLVESFAKQWAEDEHKELPLDDFFETKVTATPALEKAIRELVINAMTVTMIGIVKGLKEDKEWLDNKLAQYKHGVSDAHMARLANAIRSGKSE